MTAPCNRCWLLICLCLFLAASGARAASIPADKLERDVQRVANAARPAFVFIGGGSGAVISPDGYMVTNHHVIGGKTDFTVRLGSGVSFPAKVVGRDPQGDLALLKLKDAKDLPHLPLGDADALQIGDLCIAIGNPLALGAVDQTPTVSYGVISALHQYRGGGRYNDAIVTDAPINPGNSGGPLINMQGELVGVNGMVETRIGLRSNTGLGFAIPANPIKRFLPALRAEGLEVYHARLLGIRFETDNENAPMQGALVKDVLPETDAAAAGFQAGDLVTTLQEKPVWSPVRFWGIYAGYPVGTEMTAAVERDKEIVTLTWKADARQGANLDFKLARPGAGDRHVRLREVDLKSPAGEAGLRAGDEIIALGPLYSNDFAAEAQKLEGPVTAQFAKVVSWMRRIVAGAQVSFTVRRLDAGRFETVEIQFRAPAKQ